MTSTERHDLLALARQREKVALADAKEYQVTLLAVFERKLAAIYKPEDHPVWKEAAAAAKRACAEAQARIQATFRELGIPEEWAPGIQVSWYRRGANAVAERRAELRRVAQAEADRRLRSAQAAIKKRSVEAQEQIIASGLTSEAARALLAALPKPAQLMPELDIEALERLVTAPPISRLSPAAAEISATTLAPELLPFPDAFDAGEAS